MADSGRVDLLHLIGSSLAGSGHADGSLLSRLCMLGESAVIVPKEIPSTLDWQQQVVEYLRIRNLGATAAFVVSDALNLD